MKLCQKCRDEINDSVLDISETRFYGLKVVPESECEFWAHQAYLKEIKLVLAIADTFSRE